MFDIHESVFDPSGEPDEDRFGAYVEGLMTAFAASPEAQPLLDAGAGVGWVRMMMDYGLNYCGVTPAEMSLRDFDEVLFELFPRKVSTPPERAPAIVNELRAFWQFVQRQYGLKNAAPILDLLDSAGVERLRRNLADPSCWGMAKSMFMRGQEAGFDMTTQEGLDQFLLVYNNQLLSSPGLLPLGPGPADFLALPPDRPSRDEREEKRKARKRQRQARKRNRK